MTGVLPPVSAAIADTRAQHVAATRPPTAADNRGWRGRDEPTSRHGVDRRYAGPRLPR